MADKVKKSALTRQKLVEAATSLFEEKGFEGATMRLVAERAGVSVGNAYYYFRSKEELIQGYYSGLVEGFDEKVQPVLAVEKSLEARLTKAMDLWLAHIGPQHTIASDLFKFAADPKSPMSPFSADSQETRDRQIRVWRDLVGGSEKLKASEDLRARLPEIIWMFQMGVTVFWVYDQSRNQQRTKLLVKGATPLISKLVLLSRVPVVRGTVDEALELMTKLMK